MIRKFKNGNLRLIVENSDFRNGEVNENFYHDEMFMSDLYINQIYGYHYIVDFNKSLVYELGSSLMQNPLKWLLDELAEHKKLILYPLSERESASLIEDLENGY